jgi:glycosyltransferase involved in cell wall biosynthesis
VNRLVSVIIPTYQRPELLLTRSIPSVLAQTYKHLDLHVVGDGCTEETLHKMGDLRAVFKDRRVRFTNRPRPSYPGSELDAWHIAGSYATNYGLDTAWGQYVCGLGDDDALEPEYVEALLDGLLEQDVDMTYCISQIEGSGYLGCDYPPQFARQSGGEFLWKKNFVRLDPECWRKGLPNDWDFHSRMMAQPGFRVGRVPRVLYHYFPSKHVPGGYPTPR